MMKINPYVLITAAVFAAVFELWLFLVLLFAYMLWLWFWLVAHED